MKFDFHIHKPNKSYRMVGLFVVAVLLLAACQPAATQPPLPTATKPAAAPTSMPPTAAAVVTVAPTQAKPAMEEPVINIAMDAKLGNILVNGKGMTLYIYTKDEANKVNCVDACLVNWPPLLTNGSPKAGTGVDAALLGSAPMPDGTKIVTYNKMPLYLWVKDTKPGDTTGQDVGKVWYVIDPTGKVIKPAESTTPAASGSATPRYDGSRHSRGYCRANHQRGDGCQAG